MIECSDVYEKQVNAVGEPKPHYGLDRIDIDIRRVLIYYLLHMHTAILIWYFRFEPVVSHLFITHGLAGRFVGFLTNYININLFGVEKKPCGGSMYRPLLHFVSLLGMTNFHTLHLRWDTKIFSSYVILLYNFSKTDYVKERIKANVNCIIKKVIYFFRICLDKTFWLIEIRSKYINTMVSQWWYTLICMYECVCVWVCVRVLMDATYIFIYINIYKKWLCCQNINGQLCSSSWMRFRTFWLGLVWFLWLMAYQPL